MMNTCLQLLIQTQTPGLIWGAPGIGKTSAVYALSKALDMPCEVTIAALCDPSDFAGLPVIGGSRYVNNQIMRMVHRSAPDWAYRLARRRSIWFLDEISTTPPAVQAVLLRSILDLKIGDLSIPKTSVLAAANPAEQAAGGWDLALPLANRFCHLSWEVDPSEWRAGFIGGWPEPKLIRLPDDWFERYGPAARSLVESFIRVRPHLLSQVPKLVTHQGRAWPSPRTWDMSSRLLAACKACKAGEQTELTLISGCVGTGPAAEFLAWIRDQDLPDPEVLLKDPDNFQIVARGDRNYAILSSVVAAVVSDSKTSKTSKTSKASNTRSRWEAVWKILSRAAEQGAADVASGVCRPLIPLASGKMKIPMEALEKFLPLLKAAELIKE